jgi:MATE family multidrug resistance protein
MSSAFIANARPLLILMLPILGTQLAQTGMGVVDTLVAGMAGTLDLAAIAVGSSIWLPIVLFVNGVLVALVPVVAQAKGAKDKQKSAQTLQQGIYLSLLIGFIAMGILLVSAEPLMLLVGVTPEIHELTLIYLQYIAYGLPAVSVMQAFRSYNEAIGLTKPVTLIAIGGLLLNIPLNIIFVFGFGPIEAMGGAGCGLASCIIFYASAVAIALFTLFSRLHKGVSPLKTFSPIHWPTQKALLAIGLPMGLAIFVEVSLFCVIALLIARLGPNVVAAHQITISVSSLIFMVPLSLAFALTVRVGHVLGQQNPKKAQKVSLTGLQLTLIFASVNAALLITLKDPIVSLYSSDPAVTALASHLLMFAAIFQFSDGLQVGAAGALRGYKDTFVTLILTIISFWVIGLPLGYYLGLSQTAPLGAEGFWIGLVAGLSVNAALLLVRLKLVSRQAIQTLGIKA